MKALEILKKRKRILLLIKASSVLTKKETIEIDKDIKDIDEVIAELEALQQTKSCFICSSFKTCGVPRLAKDELNVAYFYCNDFEQKDER